MGKILKFTISLLLITMGARGQQDSLRTYGLRLGVDLSRLVIPYFQPNRKDMEFSADMEIRNNLFGVLEGGWNTSQINNGPTFQYQSSGYFGRIGIDYNLLTHDYIQENNLAYVGLRLGHAQFHQQASHYQLIDPYWGNINSSIPLHSVQASWLEFVAGLKVEALKHFFIGWSIRARILLNNPVDPILTPYVIPGYGKGAAKGEFDVNYSLYYLIPLFKHKIEVPRISLPIPSGKLKKPVPSTKGKKKRPTK
ncbi:MAG: DUF6048 family protein [Chitinophagaceae bacterium]